MALTVRKNCFFVYRELAKNCCLINFRYDILKMRAKNILKGSDDMKRIIFIFLAMNYRAITLCTFTHSPIDLTVVGQIKFACSLPRIGIGLIDCLKDDITINYIQTGWWKPDLKDVPSNVAKIVLNENKRPGNVAILYDFLSHATMTPSEYVPKDSSIKIAYSMNESTSIPSRWPEILNKQFDLVVVPDEWLRDIYEKCGVTIPIFTLAHGIYLENFLDTSLKKKASKPFTFGLSAGFWPRKNQLLLLEAFHEEFGNNPDIQLRLHGRMGDLERSLQKTKSDIGATNITIESKVFTEQEYLSFVKSLDCVVVLSKGEGFSIPPREAVALGIPCIISDNTAHKTLSKTGYFRAVPSMIKEPAYVEHYMEALGYEFNCSRKDVRIALRDVYENYQYYLKRAEEGREWVKRYLWKNLRKKFLNLVKPQKVVLGEHNKVTNDYLMTTSKALYKKYKILKSSY